MKNTNSIDLRDVQCMPLDVNRLLNSDTWLAAADEPIIAFALMNLWMRSWHQVPAGSLPAADSILARLAMCDQATWERIKEEVLGNWVLGDDGRFYHSVIVEKAIECDEQRAKKAAFAELQRAKGLASAAARASGTKPKAKPVKAISAAVESDVSTALVSLPAAPIKIEKLDDAEVVFGYWKEVMKSKRSLLDSKRKKLINQRLKDGYTVEDLKTAILGCSLTPHNMGSTNGTLYNTIELILRDSSYIDRFMSTAMGTKDLFQTPGGDLSAAGQQSLSAIKNVFMNRQTPPATGFKEIGND